MKKSRWTLYDKYLVMADSSRVLKGNYHGYLNFKIVLDVLNTLYTKRTNSYLYNGDIVNFNLGHTDIEAILNSWNESEYHPRFELVRYISGRLNLKNI